MDRNRIIHFSSFIVLLCYLTGIIGLNVHSCHRSGKSFVTPGLQVYTCAELHQEDKCSVSECGICGTDGCSSDCFLACSEDSSIDSASCCSNSVHHLSTTGETVKKAASDVGFSFLSECPERGYCLNNQFNSNFYRVSVPDSPVLLEGGSLSSLFCIWLI